MQNQEKRNQTRQTQEEQNSIRHDLVGQNLEAQGVKSRDSKHKLRQPKILKAFDTLKNTNHFNIIFKNKLKISNDYFTLYISTLEYFLMKIQKTQRYVFTSNMLLGFSISKKVALANKRNLVRRRIKYILVNFKHYNLNNLVFVFICRKGIDGLTFSELNTLVERSILKLYKKL